MKLTTTHSASRNGPVTSVELCEPEQQLLQRVLDLITIDEPARLAREEQVATMLTLFTFFEAGLRAIDDVGAEVSDGAQFPSRTELEARVLNKLLSRTAVNSCDNVFECGGILARLHFDEQGQLFVELMDVDLIQHFAARDGVPHDMALKGAEAYFVTQALQEGVLVRRPNGRYELKADSLHSQPEA